MVSSKSRTDSNASAIRIAIIVLTLATAFIHLYLAFTFENSPDILFLLNGLGYLGLLAALYLPLPILESYRGLIRWILIAYTAVTVSLWLFITLFFATASPEWIAYVDKVIEVALIVLLWLEGQRQPR
jgi:hypothetical protein